ncbi:hypothetical protein WICPIJ_005171 [Wickerhamomyces pijperi]|uniref:Uncharacterized protein n=1 Tax=Wickerhamomyces pijperi TaxID=599730 RepID=A0A9P8TM71_WICPI|nr:hypothetical protein WICPIJ_005171 [Wickerhamomyces pijperi]
MALNRSGNPLVLQFSMAMMKGEEATYDVFDDSFGSLKGTNNPRNNSDKTLTSRDPNQLCALISERGIDQRRNPTKESPLRGSRKQMPWAPRSWVSPISEPNGTQRSTTTNHDEGIDDESHYGDDLYRGDPEFNLTVIFHRKHVNRHQNHPKDRNPSCQWDSICPKFDNLPHNRQLQCKGNHP